jgi:hypothetical protein
MTIDTLPIACDLQAIPADQRSEHIATAEHLLTSLAETTHELPNGFAFRFPAEVYPRVTAFIDNERRCCPFYTFALEVPPGGEALSLRITGPEGAKELLAAILLDHQLGRQENTEALESVAIAIAGGACACCSPASRQEAA